MRPVDRSLNQLVAALAACSLLAVAASSCTRADPDTLAIVHVALVDTELGVTLPDATVVVRGERIVDAGQGAEVPPHSTVIDGRGLFVMPGLWDMHVHLSHARASALPALVANGVTGVRDMGSDLAELDRWRTEIASGAVVGPTIVRPGPMLNGEASESHQVGARTADEARAVVRTLQQGGVDFIKVYRQLPRDAFFAAAGQARSLGLPISGHVPEFVSPAEASRAGLASIEHLETLFEGTFAQQHGGEDQARAIARWRADEGDRLAALFRANGTMVTATLIANSQVLRLLESPAPAPSLRLIAQSARTTAERTLTRLRPQAAAMRAEFGPIIEASQPIAGLFSQQGVRLLAGTDLSYLHVPGASLHDELALMVGAGVPAADALRAATVNPATLLRLSDAGKIAAGMRADLLLLAGDPLTDILNTRRVRGVVLRGRYMDRRDLDRLLDEAARLASEE